MTTLKQKEQQCIVRFLSRSKLTVTKTEGQKGVNGVYVKSFHVIGETYKAIERQPFIS